MQSYLLAIDAAWLPNDERLLFEKINVNKSMSAREPFISLLSQYLNTVDDIIFYIDERRFGRIYGAKYRYDNKAKESKTREAYEALQAEIAEIHSRSDKALQIMRAAKIDLIDMYKGIIRSCPHNDPHNLALLYNKGVLSIVYEDYAEALDSIEKIIEFAEASNQQKLLTSEMFQKKGSACLEVGRYHEAISALSEAINKDPKNKEAYFDRASAYFETGDFDKALSDYLASEKKKDLYNEKPNLSGEFLTGLMEGLRTGSGEAVTEFAPSLLASAYGLGECLWTFAQHPIEMTTNFGEACYEAGECGAEFFKTLDREQVDECVEEIKELYSKFENLPSFEKGILIGHAVGKYGIEILVPGTALKAIAAYKKLKTANRICNLEAMALSESNKEIIAASAVKHAEERSLFFREVKIEFDKQNKHVPGKHNYIPGRSIFEHKEPQTLLEKFAGKGTSIKNRELGKPDYREKINFEEFIGYHINRETKIKTATTWGEIRYSKSGAHIVPVLPEQIHAY